MILIKGRAERSNMMDQRGEVICESLPFSPDVSNSYSSFVLPECVCAQEFGSLCVCVCLHACVSNLIPANEKESEYMKSKVQRTQRDAPTRSGK